MEEIKQYLKENLKINLHYVGDNAIEACLILDNEVISNSYIHYRVK